MNALQKTGEEGQRERVETGCQARRSKDQHAMAMLIQRRGRTQAGLACQMGADPFSERRKLVPGIRAE